MAGIEVFLSYSHADEGLVDELVKHLNLLRRQNLIEPWYDRRIEAGAKLHTQIDARLNSADVILLLVSPDFVSSDYCYEREMERALDRHRVGAATVMPVILRPCDWHSAPFGDLMAVPKDGLAVTEHANRDRAYLEIAQAVRKAAERLRASSGPASKPTDGPVRSDRGATLPVGTYWPAGYQITSNALVRPSGDRMAIIVRLSDGRQPGFHVIPATGGPALTHESHESVEAACRTLISREDDL